MLLREISYMLNNLQVQFPGVCWASWCVLNVTLRFKIVQWRSKETEVYNTWKVRHFVLFWFTLCTKFKIKVLMMVKSWLWALILRWTHFVWSKGRSSVTLSKSTKDIRRSGWKNGTGNGKRTKCVILTQETNVYFQQSTNTQHWFLLIMITNQVLITVTKSKEP